MKLESDAYRAMERQKWCEEEPDLPVGKVRGGGEECKKEEEEEEREK